MNDMIQFFRQFAGHLGSSLYAGLRGPVHPQQLAFLRQMQRELKESRRQDASLQNLKVVVFDLETTGFFPDKGDQVISIGAVKMTGSSIHANDCFYSLVRCDAPLSEEVTHLTKITEKMLQDAPPAADVLMAFFKYIRTNDLVAHHSRHELRFMQKMTWDVTRTKFAHRILDTSFLIQLTAPMSAPLPLEDVCKSCGIAVRERHHALGDALMTAEVWAHFLSKAQSMGYQTLRDVYDHLARIS